MKTKHLLMEIDEESGNKEIFLSGEKVRTSVSISNNGPTILDERGADIMLHFDKDNKLVSIELMGL